MGNCKEFLKYVSGREDPVDQQLGMWTVKQVDENRKVWLSIIDAVKTVGKMSVSRKGHRDN